MDADGNYVTHINISSWDYDEIYSNILDLLPEPEYLDYSLYLHEGANLISFASLPEDVSVPSIFAGADMVLGEGVAAMYVNNMWVGALQEVSQDAGYWAFVSENMTLELLNTTPVYQGLVSGMGP